MATSRIDRSDDTAAVLKIIATVNGTEDAVTKEWQAVTISDSTNPVANKLAVNVGGAASVIGAANSGVDIGDVTVNNAAGASAVNIQDGGNALTVDWAGTAPPIGAGLEATALRVTLATDSTGLVSVDDNAGSLTVDGTVTANLSATDNAVLDAIEVDTTTLAGAVAGTEMQVDVVAALPTGTNTIGNVGTLPLTAGGCSMYHKVSAATDNAANIKASAGQVYGITIYNNAGYPVYVKLHNTAGVPTAGAGVVRAFGCQAGTQTTYPITHGAAFGTGIGITIIKDITDAGTTATAASDCVVGVEYK